MVGVELTPSRPFVCVAFWQFSRPNWMKTSRKKNITHSYIFLFPKEAHANVVPQRGTLRHSTCCHPVLVHSHIKVTMGLHHAACSQDGLGIKTMIREILEEDVALMKDESQAVTSDRE